MGKVSSVPSFARQERLALEKEQEEEQDDGIECDRVLYSAIHTYINACIHTYIHIYKLR